MTEGNFADYTKVHLESGRGGKAKYPPAPREIYW
jgi:hypothetical protein